MASCQRPASVNIDLPHRSIGFRALPRLGPRQARPDVAALVDRRGKASGLDVHQRPALGDQCNGTLVLAIGREVRETVLSDQSVPGRADELVGPRSRGPDLVTLDPYPHIWMFAVVGKCLATDDAIIPSFVARAFAKADRLKERSHVGILEGVLQINSFHGARSEERRV